MPLAAAAYRLQYQSSGVPSFLVAMVFLAAAVSFRLFRLAACRTWFWVASRRAFCFTCSAKITEDLSKAELMHPCWQRGFRLSLAV